MWKPCLPGVRPVISATTFISSLDLVNVTEPATVLPAVGCRTAIAFVGSCALVRQILRRNVSAPRKNFVFIRQLYAPNRESETALINQSFLKSRVSVNATITQERPMSSVFVDPLPINLRGHNFFAINRTFGADFAVRAAHKTLAPEFDPVTASGRFVSYAVRHRDVAAIRNGMTALNRFPGRMLRLAKLLLLFWMPADRGRIKNDLRAAQRSQTRRFWIPLVPANADTEISARCFPALKTEIARRKIEFLVIKRIVRDVHLAILAKQLAVGVDDRGGVVIKTGGAFLKKGCNNDDAKLACELRQRVCRRARNRFG